MNKFGSVYKLWIRHLIKKGLYITWIQDLRYLANKDSLEVIEREKQRFTSGFDTETQGYFFWFDPFFNSARIPQKDLVINTDGRHTWVLRVMKCESVLELRDLLTNITDKKSFYVHVSRINWRHEYEEFANRQFVLSKKLSKKISKPIRINHIQKSKEKHKEEQPWYSKSYEKRFKNIWRR